MSRDRKDESTTLLLCYQRFNGFVICSSSVLVKKKSKNCSTTIFFVLYQYLLQLLQFRVPKPDKPVFSGGDVPLYSRNSTGVHRPRVCWRAPLYAMGLCLHAIRKGGRPLRKGTCFFSGRSVPRRMEYNCPRGTLMLPRRHALCPVVRRVRGILLLSRVI